MIADGKCPLGLLIKRRGSAPRDIPIVPSHSSVILAYFVSYLEILDALLKPILKTCLEQRVSTVKLLWWDESAKMIADEECPLGLLTTRRDSASRDIPIVPSHSSVIVVYFVSDLEVLAALLKPILRTCFEQRVSTVKLL